MKLYLGVFTATLLLISTQTAIAGSSLTRTFPPICSEVLDAAHCVNDSFKGYRYLTEQLHKYVELGDKRGVAQLLEQQLSSSKYINDNGCNIGNYPLLKEQVQDIVAASKAYENMVNAIYSTDAGKTKSAEEQFLVKLHTAGQKIKGIVKQNKRKCELSSDILYAVPKE